VLPVRSCPLPGKSKPMRVRGWGKWTDSSLNDAFVWAGLATLAQSPSRPNSYVGQIALDTGRNLLLKRALSSLHGLEPPMTDEDPQEREVPSGVFGGVSDDSYMDGVGRRWVIGTSVLCLIVGILGHAAIWYGYGRGLSANPIQWWSEKPVIGLSLASIALIAFGGFLEATRRMRVAISASFLLTFLLTKPCRSSAAMW
jgi:hypothetical protein